MKALFKKILFAFLLFFGTLFLLEIVLGAAFLYKDRNIEPENVKDFPYVYYLFDNKKGDYNEHGFKTNYSIQKPENTFRIILTGGSVARGKDPEQTIAAYLEKNLQKQFPQKNIQVINAGVSGYGVQQEFLLIQMILQQYQPDMIIGLDGYNDMLTFKLNRFYPSGYDLPPHHWEQFRIIKQKNFQQKWYSRFSAPFNNINRVKDFLIRNSKEKKYDWNTVNEAVAEKHAQAYWNVVQDCKHFCKAKGIDYVSFLQPVRFYNPLSEPDFAEHKALSKIYRQMEAHYKQSDFGYSLIPAFHKCKGMYTDDCHINTEGNQIIAIAIAEKIKGKLLPMQ